MRYNQNWTRTKQLLTLWISLSLILTCFPNSSLADPSPYHLLPIQEEAPSRPSLILVDQEKLNSFIEKFKNCVQFANTCQERVSLLEEYKTDADAALVLANQDATMARQDLATEKTKAHFIYPIVALVLGVALGHFIVK